VGVRIRPPSSSEVPSTLSLASTFTPHHLLPPSTSQDASYSTLTSTLLTRLASGYSTTLLAYGQTGSGKTHTIFGPPGCLRADAPESERGLLPRLLQEFLNAPGQKIAASAIEVYQDLAYDLLASSAPLTVGTKGSGQIFAGKAAVQSNGSELQAGIGGAHPAGCQCRLCMGVKLKSEEEFKQRMAERRGEARFASGVDPMKCKAPATVAKVAPSKGGRRASAGAKEAAAADDYATVGEKLVPINCLADILGLCRSVELSRTTVSHDLNERSSRSHCLVTVHLDKEGGGHNTCLLVDLAGSERIEKTNVQGNAKAQVRENARRR